LARTRRELNVVAAGSVDGTHLGVQLFHCRSLELVFGKNGRKGVVTFGA
jgi:hypothetical protein